MGTPGFFNFGNDREDAFFEPTLTREGWYRSVAQTGHPPTHKPDHYDQRGDGKSNGQRASAVRCSQPPTHRSVEA